MQPDVTKCKGPEYYIRNPEIRITELYNTLKVGYVHLIYVSQRRLITCGQL